MTNSKKLYDEFLAKGLIVVGGLDLHAGNKYNHVLEEAVRTVEETGSVNLDGLQSEEFKTYPSYIDLDGNGYVEGKSPTLEAVTLRNKKTEETVTDEHAGSEDTKDEESGEVTDTETQPVESQPQSATMETGAVDSAEAETQASTTESPASTTEVLSQVDPNTSSAQPEIPPADTVPTVTTPTSETTPPDEVVPPNTDGQTAPETTTVDSTAVDTAPDAPVAPAVATQPQNTEASTTDGFTITASKSAFADMIGEQLADYAEQMGLASRLTLEGVRDQQKRLNRLVGSIVSTRAQVDFEEGMYKLISVVFQNRQRAFSDDNRFRQLDNISALYMDALDKERLQAIIRIVCMLADPAQHARLRSGYTFNSIERTLSANQAARFIAFVKRYVS